MSVHATVIMDAEGNVRFGTVFVEDMTDRKKLKEQLAVSGEGFRRLFETANDEILLLEKSALKIRFTNPAFTALSGYSNDECFGKGLGDVGFADHVGNYQEVMQKLNNNDIIHYKETPIQEKTGPVVYTDIYMVNKADLVQCNIRNITDRKRGMII